MRTVIRMGIVASLILTALLSGCQNQPSPTQATDEPYPLDEATPELVETQAPDSGEPYPGVTEAPSPVTVGNEIEALIAGLKAAGAAVEIDGTISQSFFSPLGQIIRVNGQEVQVFVYSSEAAAQSEAAGVSPDGSAVGNEQIAWVATPHFFRQGKLIVLYAGDEAAVLQVLQNVLGEQFAGR